MQWDGILQVHRVLPNPRDMRSRARTRYGNDACPSDRQRKALIESARSGFGRFASVAKEEYVDRESPTYGSPAYPDTPHMSLSLSLSSLQSPNSYDLHSRSTKPTPLPCSATSSSSQTSTPLAQIKPHHAFCPHPQLGAPLTTSLPLTFPKGKKVKDPFSLRGECKKRKKPVWIKFLTTNILLFHLNCLRISAG